MVIAGPVKAIYVYPTFTPNDILTGPALRDGHLRALKRTNHCRKGKSNVEYVYLTQGKQSDWTKQAERGSFFG